MSRINRICTTCDKWLPAGETKCATHKGTTPRWGVVAEAPSIGGKRRRKVRKGFATKRDAETALAALMTELERGTFVDKDATTVADWMDRHMENGSWEHNTRKNYELMVRTRINPGIGHLKLQQLDKRIVIDFYNDLAKRMKPNTVKKTHSLLRSALNDAVELKVIRSNPPDKAFKMKVKKEEINPRSA